VPFLTPFPIHSAPLSNVAGTITDLIPTAKSGYAIALYALASVIGPALGSVMGGYPVEKLGWRWLYWIYAIVFGAHIIVIWAFMPETRENIGRSYIPPTSLVANSDR
jgi:MFS family permease